jgi:hypothetical protein
MNQQQRDELIQGYLRVPAQLSEQESEALEQIKTILMDYNVGPLARQRLAFQLIGEVEKFLEADLAR